MMDYKEIEKIVCFASSVEWQHLYEKINTNPVMEYVLANYSYFHRYAMPEIIFENGQDNKKTQYRSNLIQVVDAIHEINHNTLEKNRITSYWVNVDGELIPFTTVVPLASKQVSMYEIKQYDKYLEKYQKAAHILDKHVKNTLNFTEDLREINYERELTDEHIGAFVKHFEFNTNVLIMMLIVLEQDRMLKVCDYIMRVKPELLNFFTQEDKFTKRFLRTLGLDEKDKKQLAQQEFRQALDGQNVLIATLVDELEKLEIIHKFRQHFLLNNKLDDKLNAKRHKI